MTHTEDEIDTENVIGIMIGVVTETMTGAMIEKVIEEENEIDIGMVKEVGMALEGLVIKSIAMMYEILKRRRVKREGMQNKLVSILSFNKLHNLEQCSFCKHQCKKRLNSMQNLFS